MNIILLISDTFRYDNLFGRASMPVNTPELDRFSERAVSMENCWVSSFPTIPHRTDLTTGRYGWPWYPWQPRPKSGPNHAPEILRQAGFVSQLLCDCPHLFKADFNFGFDASYALRGQEGDKYLLRMNYPLREVMPKEKTRAGDHFQGHNLPDISRWVNMHWRGEEDRLMARTARLAVEWLEENYKYDPFFVWVDFFDPHEPWDPPEYMVRKYDPDYDGTPMIHPNYGKASDLTPDELRNLRAHYCAEAELVDRWVGRVLQKIDDLDLWKNSVVIFTTDHGMSLGEHNRTGKSNINPGDDRIWPIYPEIAHIPLMIAAPGLHGGGRVEEFVQPPDILPTAMDLAGADVRPPEDFHGKSFAPMLRGEAQPALRDFVISGQFSRPNHKSGGVPNCSPVVYTREWAYAPIGPEKSPELFDLSADRYAERNVIADNAGVAKEMHERLLGWLAEVGAPEEALAPFRS
jgi:arylsulfatase A-like enzyme